MFLPHVGSVYVMSYLLFVSLAQISCVFAVTAQVLNTHFSIAQPLCICV